MSSSASNGPTSLYSDRVCLSHFTTNLSLGEEKVLGNKKSTKKQLHIQTWEKEKLVDDMCPCVSVLQPAFCSTEAHIKAPDQIVRYCACKKVTEAKDSGYWCDRCLSEKG